MFRRRRSWWQRQPLLLLVTAALVGYYIALAERSDIDAARTFTAALAAMFLGALLYSLAHGDLGNKDDDEDPDAQKPPQD